MTISEVAVSTPDGGVDQLTSPSTYPRIGSSGVSTHAVTGTDTVSMMRATAGSAVRSPTSNSQVASAGIANDPFGSLTLTSSPTQSVEAHSVTRPCSCTTMSSVSSAPSHARTV